MPRTGFERLLFVAAGRAVRAGVGRRLWRIERAVATLANQIEELSDSVRRPADSARRRPSKGRQRHGRYIGLLRHLPKRAQVNVRRIRAERGVEAAIRAAERLRERA
jgi:hypothetical protein